MMLDLPVVCLTLALTSGQLDFLWAISNREVHPRQSGTACIITYDTQNKISNQLKGVKIKQICITLKK